MFEQADRFYVSDWVPETNDEEAAGRLTETVWLACRVNDSDEQLGRGLDLAKIHGQVHLDPETGERFVPNDAASRERSASPPDGGPW